MAAPPDPDTEPTEVSGLTGNRPATAGAATGAIAPGRLLGHTYRIEALLGRGGMGEVYRARHAELNSEHAIKIILPELANTPLIVDLFRREASNLRTIRNDVIVGYEGVFRDETGRLYLVMEYVDGPSLSKLLKEGPLSAAAVRQLRDRLVNGLAAAHEKGVFHRDLSPDNVILPGGNLANAKIIDFGISKVADPETKTIIGDAFAGKYSYVSPEQLGMFGGNVDGRSDIFSLGLVLAAAAIGEALDMGASPSTAIDARRAVPRLDRVPAELRAELAAMLQPDPADRPQSMRDLLQQSRAGERSTPQSPPGPGPKPSRRTPVTIGALALLLAVGGGVAYLFWPPAIDTETLVRNAMQAIQGLGCADLSVAASRGRDITVTGYIADEAARQEIAARLREVPDVAGVNDGTEALSPPLCEAIRMVVGDTTSKAGDPSVPRIDPGANGGLFHKDELLAVSVTATAPSAGFLSIDLVDAGGAAVYHLLPNNGAQPSNAVAGSTRIDTGTLEFGADKQHITVVEPFGKALVFALWTSQPLHPQLRPFKEPNTIQYLGDLRDRLRQLGRNNVFGSFSVLTLEP